MRTLVAAIAALCLSASVAHADVVQFGPQKNPTPTPQPDAKVILGLPEPSAAPTCGLNRAGFYGDRNGCVYVCAGGKTSVVSNSSTGPCAFATNANVPTATPTPIPTATATPTKTATP